MEQRRLDICISEWLEESKRNAVKALTYDRLLVSFKLMLNYPIATFKVDDLDSRSVQRYLNNLVMDGYSISTIRKQFNLITAYWKWAMAQGLVVTPVYLGVNMPSENAVTAPKREVETYSRDEQERLLERLVELQKDQYGVAVLMLEAGLRVGEALALTWDDVLWGRKAIKVHRTLIRMSSEPTTYVQDTPKSKTSKRVIPLSAKALEVLQKLKDRKKFSTYIFSSGSGEDLPYSYSSIEFHIRQLCKDLGISYRGLHAFRHTFASNCYERGCDVKLLSKLLGHADVAITYNIYIHLYGDALEEMRKVIE